MSDEINEIGDLTREQTARFIMDLFHRIVVHYGLWFAEAEHQLGWDRALEILDVARTTSLPIQMRRLARTLGFEMDGDIPAALMGLPREKMDDLLEAVGVNWIANDGVWFQAVEFSHGMFDAKRANDTCWTRFSPFEAWSVRRFLDLPQRPGLEGLKRALRFRLYALVNTQSIVEEGPDSFVFQMNDCRVQSARRRKGLEDYPCKSVGMVEYPSFARSIDPRIDTECVGCPPDDHPQHWFCAWRFRLGDKG